MSEWHAACAQRWVADGGRDPESASTWHLRSASALPPARHLVVELARKQFVDLEEGEAPSFIEADRLKVAVQRGHVSPASEPRLGLTHDMSGASVAFPMAMYELPRQSELMLMLGSFPETGYGLPPPLSDRLGSPRAASGAVAIHMEYGGLSGDNGTRVRVPLCMRGWSSETRRRLSQDGSRSRRLETSATWTTPPPADVDGFKHDGGSEAVLARVRVPAAHYDPERSASRTTGPCVRDSQCDGPKDTSRVQGTGPKDTPTPVRGRCIEGLCACPLPWSGHGCQRKLTCVVHEPLDGWRSHGACELNLTATAQDANVAEAGLPIGPSAIAFFFCDCTVIGTFDVLVIEELLDEELEPRPLVMVGSSDTVDYAAYVAALLMTITYRQNWIVIAMLIGLGTMYTCVCMCAKVRGKNELPSRRAQRAVLEPDLRRTPAPLATCITPLDPSGPMSRLWTLQQGRMYHRTLFERLVLAVLHLPIAAQAEGGGRL